MKFAIGTAQFGAKYGVLNNSDLISASEVSDILNVAFESDVDTLDTAIGYGDSERVLGEAGVDNFRIVSKVPSLPEGIIHVEPWLLNQVHSSIARLKVESLYGLLIHRPSELMGVHGNEIFKALKNIQELGLVKKIGISIYGPEEYFCLPNKYKFDLVQLPFNIVDRRALDSGLLDCLYRAGIEIHVRSIFLQGLLLANKGEIPKKFHQWINFFDEWDRWTQATNITKIEACLGFINSHSSISRVIVGVDNSTNLKEILKCTNTLKIHFPKFTIPNIDVLINPYKWSKL